MYRTFGKRILDFYIAFTGLILLSPLFFALAVLLALSFKGSPFFFQPRPGYKGRIFRIVKFKTMRNIKDPKDNLLPDYQRTTPLGAIIRRTSLDELPQLWNVLTGDMSIIGPRPLLVEYLPLYQPSQRKRHDVRPGITGWAQINGGNTISWENKFELDIWYIENQSVALDLKILFLTLLQMCSLNGSNSGSKMVTEKFKG